MSGSLGFAMNVESSLRETNNVVAPLQRADNNVM